MDPIKNSGKIGVGVMKGVVTTPKKIKLMLVLCIAGAVITSGVTLMAYINSRNTAQAVGRDTVPSITAALNIKATLANAHSNAMNAMVTKEKLGGKFWNLYRKDMDSLHSQLVNASKDITYGDAERIPLTTISSNISAYEYTVGGSVASGAEISVDQFMEANRLMQQKILPASTALNKVNISKLDSIYNDYAKNIDTMFILMVVIGIVFIIILITAQVYLFRRTHRVFNAGLLIATMFFAASLIFTANALSSVKKDIFTAKNDAFTSINALWNARAVAYNAKSIESLYLLHEGTGIVQTADTINFNLSASKLCSDAKTAQANGKFEGYLNDELNNITFDGEQSVAQSTLSQWVKYVEADKKVRSLEYDSKHNEAVAVSVGTSAGQSDYEFTRFDEAIGKTIKINQENFDSSIDSAFKTLNIFPIILAAFMILVVAACMLGMKSRLDEYKV
jgi:CHASE3 domain sensor protein